MYPLSSVASLLASTIRVTNFQIFYPKFTIRKYTNIRYNILEIFLEFLHGAKQRKTDNQNFFYFYHVIIGFETSTRDPCDFQTFQDSQYEKNMNP